MRAIVWKHSNIWVKFKFLGDFGNCGKIRMFEADLVILVDLIKQILFNFGEFWKQNLVILVNTRFLKQNLVILINTRF